MLHEEYVGSYAEGQSERHLKRGILKGDFAAGQEKTPRVGTVQPVGDFAGGEEKQPTDPTTMRGDFARGQRELPLD